MRPRLLVLCAVVVAALALPAGPASAATERCPTRDGVFAQYRVTSGPSGGVTCTSAFSVLFKGILNHATPTGWRCRQPRASAWPVVETCERRSRGRRTATAELRVVDDFYGTD